MGAQAVRGAVRGAVARDVEVVGVLTRNHGVGELVSASSTDLMYCGLVSSEMSKILMPSHEDLTFADWPVLLQLSSLREESVDR